MKRKNNVLIIIIIILLLIVASVIYMVSKRKDTFHNSPKYVPKYVSLIDDLINRGILTPSGGAPKTYSKEKNNYVLSIISNDNIFATKEGYSPFDVPTKEEAGWRRKEEYDKAKAKYEKDKKKRDSFVKDSLKTVAGVAADPLQKAAFAFWDFDDEFDNKTSILKVLAIEIGINVLKTAMTAYGLGGFTSLIDSFLGIGGGAAVPPIDYDKIRKIVGQELVKNDMMHCSDNMTNAIQFFCNIYGDLKNKMNVTCDPQLVNECLSNPSYDPNIVMDYEDVSHANKRIELNNLLGGNGSILYNIVYGNTNYNYTWMLNTANKDITYAVAIFPAYLLYIQVLITFKQEQALIDTQLINGKFINPWKSTHIGNPLLFGKNQPQSPGSLLGMLQMHCVKLLELIKIMFKLYYYNLIWDKTGAGDSAKWYLDNWNDKEKDGFEVEGNEWSIRVDKDQHREVRGEWEVKNGYMQRFSDYMDDPISQLQIVKKMCGIKELPGELGYSALPIGDTSPTYGSKVIIYAEDGGFPFGLNKMCYRDAVYCLKPENAAECSGSYKIFNQSTYCSPETRITFDMRNSCPNLVSPSGTFDGSIYKGGNKEYSKKSVCSESATGIKSCLLPGKSPGSLNSPENRGIFCTNSKDGINVGGSQIIDFTGVCNNNLPAYLIIDPDFVSLFPRKKMSDPGHDVIIQLDSYDKEIFRLNPNIKIPIGIALYLKFDVSGEIVRVNHGNTETFYAVNATITASDETNNPKFYSKTPLVLTVSIFNIPSPVLDANTAYKNFTFEITPAGLVNSIGYLSIKIDFEYNKECNNNFPKCQDFADGGFCTDPAQINYMKANCSLACKPKIPGLKCTIKPRDI